MDTRRSNSERRYHFGQQLRDVALLMSGEHLRTVNAGFVLGVPSFLTSRRGQHSQSMTSFVDYGEWGQVMTIACDDDLQIICVPFHAARRLEEEGNFGLLLCLYQLLAFTTAQQRTLRFSQPWARSVCFDGSYSML